MFYVQHWVLYQPFLFNTNLLWLPVFAAVLNLFPVASFGHVQVRRLGVHHFVYGFIIVAAALVFMSGSLSSFFVLNSRDLRLVVGRVFLLVGLALVVDDFADISVWTRKGLRFVGSVLQWGHRFVHALHGLLSLSTLLVFLLILVWLTRNPHGANLANFVLEGSLLVTSLIGVGTVGRKVWLRMKR